MTNPPGLSPSGLTRRVARAAFHTTRLHLIPFALWPLGWLRGVHQIVAAWPEGVVALGPRVALLCHFDRTGRVRDDLLGHIAALRAGGFSVVLVSNSGPLCAGAMARVRPLCAAVLARRNVGYDFGAWRDALDHLHLPRPDTERLLLANDSVYGPLLPLAPVLERIERADADVVALTDSEQVAWHLQSYFLSFGPGALRSPAWRRFWRGVRPVPSKQWVITHCEVGLTRRLRRAGLRCACLWPCSELGAGEVNPTHQRWQELLETGFPFLKRELLHDNPARVPDVAAWRAVAARAGATGLEAIERDVGGWSG